MAAKNIRASFCSGSEELYNGTLEVPCTQASPALLQVVVKSKATSLHIHWGEDVALEVRRETAQSLSCQSLSCCRGTPDNFSWETAWRVLCKFEGVTFVVTAAPAAGAAAGASAAANIPPSMTAASAAADGSAGSSAHANTTPSVAAASAAADGGAGSSAHANTTPSVAAASAAAVAVASGGPSHGPPLAAAAVQAVNTSGALTLKKRVRAGKRKASREKAARAEPETCRTMRPMNVLASLVRAGSTTLELVKGYQVMSKREAILLVAEYCECVTTNGAKNRTAAIYSLGNTANAAWAAGKVAGRKPTSTVTRCRARCHDFKNCPFVADWQRKSPVDSPVVWELVHFTAHTLTCAKPKSASAYSAQMLAQAYISNGGSTDFAVMGKRTLAPALDRFTREDASDKAGRGKIHRAKLTVKLSQTGTLQDGLSGLQPWLRALRRLGNHAALLEPFDAATMNQLNINLATKEHDRKQKLTPIANRTPFDPQSIKLVTAGLKYFHGYIVLFQVAKNMLELGLLDGVFATDVCHNKSGPGVLFFLVGYDANRCIVYLGYMFTIATESASTWALFFEGVHKYFGNKFDCREHRLLTDADKGCFKASDLKLMYIGLFLCLKHLFANLKKNKAIEKQHIDLLYAATQLKDRQAALDAWHALPKGGLIKYLTNEKIGPVHVLPAVGGRMRRRATSNQAESTNQAINAARKCGNYFHAGKWIFQYVAATHAALYRDAQNCKGHLAPRPARELADTYRRMEGLNPIVTAQDNHQYTVSFGGTTAHTVNLDQLTCTCGVRSCDGNLCICLIAALDKSTQHGSVESNVDTLYTTDIWRAQRGIAFDVPPVDDRPKPAPGSDSDEDLVLPVAAFAQRGRPCIKRKEAFPQKPRKADLSATRAALSRGTQRPNVPPPTAAASNTTGDNLVATARGTRSVASVCRNGGSDIVPAPGAPTQRVPPAVFGEWASPHEAVCAGCSHDTNEIIGSARTQVLHCHSCPRTLCGHKCQEQCPRLQTTAGGSIIHWVVAYVAQPSDAQPGSLHFCQDCWWCHRADIAAEHNLVATSTCGAPPPSREAFLNGAWRAVLSWDAYKARPAVSATELADKVAGLLPHADGNEALRAVQHVVARGWDGKVAGRAGTWRFVQAYAETTASAVQPFIVWVEPLPPPCKDRPSAYERLTTAMARSRKGLAPRDVASRAGFEGEEGMELVRVGVQLGHFVDTGSGVTVASDTLQRYPAAVEARRIADLTIRDFVAALQQQWPTGVPLSCFSATGVQETLERRFGGSLQGREEDIRQALTLAGEGNSSSDDADGGKGANNEVEDLRGWSRCTLCDKTYDDNMHSLCPRQRCVTERAEQACRMRERAVQDEADLRGWLADEFSVRARREHDVDGTWRLRIAGVCRIARAGLVGCAEGGDVHSSVKGASAKYRALRLQAGVLAGWEEREACGALVFARILRHADFFVSLNYSTSCWGGNDLLTCITHAAALPGSRLPRQLVEMSVVDGKTTGKLVVTTFSAGRTSKIGTRTLADLNPTKNPVLLRGPKHYNGSALSLDAKQEGIPMDVPVARRQDVQEWLSGFKLYPVHSTGGGYCWFESFWWALAALKPPVLAEELLLHPNVVGDEVGCGECVNPWESRSCGNTVAASADNAKQEGRPASRRKRLRPKEYWVVDKK